MKPKALILRAAGTNCDRETAYAFELAGARTQTLHINRVTEDPAILANVSILAFPGGFSYGDDISAGKILALQTRGRFGEAMSRLVDRGGAIIGICNGFQVLVKAGLLPGNIQSSSRQSCTLTNNDSGRFTCRWVHLSAPKSRCLWTEGLDHLDLPIAHGEGKFVAASDAILKTLADNRQVVLRYANAAYQPAQGAAPDNPNGSQDDIAGICDSTGQVFGLMPHPERFLSAFQHPQAAGDPDAPGQGLAIFQNAVKRYL